MLPHWIMYLILFSSGIIAGFVNILAGAGSALTLPILIFSGLTPAVANGTNRIGILFENVLASHKFVRAGVVQPSFALRLALWALPGAVIGAWSSIHVGSFWFQRILVIILGFSAITLYLPIRPSKQVIDLIENKSIAIYPIMVLLGFYGGFIQAGIGFLFIFFLRWTLRINLAAINGLKTTIISAYTVPVLIIFVMQGNIAWVSGLFVAAGGIFGAYFSSKITLSSHGEFWIKIMVTFVILVMGIKLWYF
ncbi:sulfite exporter TauE/SafE family protein [Acidithiobacillus sp. AMEEHan]|uniref:sulfite exporter TauE/SafE family protein n=1 Tax=Acidithiobacillus sp. AMEEHan TaxID=2994951 RepID=UPI0027E4B7C6|nr:sulfite exporter TauE/SafE family protein [Acidithiobacillus sp. AMEEHan]